MGLDNLDINKIKKSEGITLIAIVINIIIILLLAGVTIAMMTDENGILVQVKEAQVEITKAGAKEKVELAKQAASLKGNKKLEFVNAKEELEKIGYILGKPNNFPIRIMVDGYLFRVDGNIEYLEETTIGKINENKTKYVVEEEGKKKIVPIPAGFKISDKEGEQTINDGLVIIDEKGNEFVWIHTEKVLNEMYRFDNKKVYGILYDFLKFDENKNPLIETNNVEPKASIKYDNKYLSHYKFLSGEEAKNLEDVEEILDIEFNAFVQETEATGGFYVSRYEMSLDENGNAQSMKNVTATVSTDEGARQWYGLYNKAKTYKNGEITSSMMWGCQYDQMMKWMLKSGLDITKTDPVNNGWSNDARNKTKITGSCETDKLKNIYDLIGCNYEWLMTEDKSGNRIIRGGTSENANMSPSRNAASYPLGTFHNYSTRIILYI